ncbi:hypothetical protein ACHWQZ_G001706 [Mnemiopsis leidyi]
MFVLIVLQAIFLTFNGDITGYEEIDGKSCTNPYTKDGGCNGWSNVDKEVCLQNCDNNISPNPTNCPVPTEGCRYAVWYSSSKWCHLDGDTCDLTANTNAKIYKKKAESCKKVESNLAVDLQIEDSQFPLEHGTEIPYRCPQRYAKKNNDDVAVCKNGAIVLPVEPCSKIARKEIYKNLATKRPRLTVAVNQDFMKLNISVRTVPRQG